MTKDEKRLKAVHHVVHDYANLVSSGTLTQDTTVKPPFNTHVQHAFLLGCRKLADFFCKSSDDRDIVAADFLGKRELFPLSVWNKWGDPMNKQLAHLSYARVTKPKAWDGRRENKLLIEEFQQAWKLFRSKLPDPYRSEFEKQINQRQQPSPTGEPSEFRGLDLA